MARLAVIVLAAGQSSRFGPENKLTAPFGGAPIIRRAAAAACDAGVDAVLVVTGNERDAIAAALEGLDVRLVHNPAWERGMGSSIATGVAALDEATDGVFIVPGDMPFLSPQLFDALKTVFAQNELQAVVFPTTVSGEQRNPVLWPRKYFSELSALDGQSGAKRLLGEIAAPTVAVPFADETVFADIDSRDDLRAADTDRSA